MLLGLPRRRLDPAESHRWPNRPTSQQVIGPSSLQGALHETWAYTLFSVQPLRALCLCGSLLLRKKQPQRHRAHRGCTEKKPNRDFRAKPLRTMSITLDDLRRFTVARNFPKPTTLNDALQRMGFVQADPIRAPARAQDLILRHRVKNYHA